MLDAAGLWTGEPDRDAHGHDFGVSWNQTLDGGGVVVGDRIAMAIDVEAIRESD